MIDLVIYQPELGEAVAQLNDGTYIIGSGANCHIQLEQPGVMPRHAKFVVAGTRAGVMDLCGKTLDNQHMVLPSNKLIELQRGDEFHIGPILLRLGRSGKATESGAENGDADKNVTPLDSKTAAAEKAFAAADLAVGSGKMADKLSNADIPVLRISGVPENLRPFMQEL
ncbi:MAG: FHA domain-containing protein, partial [Victivallaceae bacterium]